MGRGHAPVLNVSSPLLFLGGGGGGGGGRIEHFYLSPKISLAPKHPVKVYTVSVLSLSPGTPLTALPSHSIRDTAKSLPQLSALFLAKLSFPHNIRSRTIRVLQKSSGGHLEAARQNEHIG